MSLEDDLFVTNALWLTAQARWISQSSARLRPVLLRVLKFHAQSVAELRNSQQRMSNLKRDRRLELMLAFSGRRE